MTPPDRRYIAWLHHYRIGTLHQRGDHTRFTLDPAYIDDPQRPVLGLLFEQNPRASHAAALRLPCWFSNLLPEGRLRDWIAADRGVSPHREMELLAQVGHDLPGAVRITEDHDDSDEPDWPSAQSTPPSAQPEQPGEDMTWRFSLAGVALKFSMLAKGERLTMPAFGAGGDWIVKLPNHVYPDVPRNEFAMMSLAGAAGIRIPEVRLVHRDEIEGLPSGVWPSTEQWAYAVRRFDRTGERVHIEDLAQVRNVYPEAKYRGNYETVANLIYRGHDVDGLRQFAKQLIFAVLISNGDAHLKNWSLIYSDPRVPTLAPAYDLVSTRYYVEDEQLGLKFAGSRRFEAVRIASLARLERRLNATDARLAEEGDAVVTRVLDAWDSVKAALSTNQPLLADITASIMERSRTLRARPTGRQ